MWANYKGGALDKTTSKTKTSCECESPWVLNNCSSKCEGTNEDKKSTDGKTCDCKKDYFRVKAGAGCANDCGEEKNVKVNTEKTACVCDDGYLEISALNCHACKDGALSCYCSDGWTGDDCTTAVKKDEDKSGNGFI